MDTHLKGVIEIKVYFYYLSVPNFPIRGVSETDLESFENFVMFLRGVCLKDGTRLDKPNSTSYFFAYTADKSLKKKFESVFNMEWFVPIVKKMDDEEYDMLNSSMEKFKIIEHEYDYATPTLKFPGPAYLEDFGYQLEEELQIKMGELASIPYYILQTEFIKALDILGYTLYHQLTGPDYEFYSYNYDYGLTPEGYASNHVRYVVKTLDLLIHNLGVLLKGES